MNELLKGFSRGLGYGISNRVLKFMESQNRIYQTNKINNENNISYNYSRQSTKLSVWFYIIAVLSFPYCIVWIPIYGIIRLNKRTTKISYIEICTTKIPDRRYSCGYREEDVSCVKYDKVEASDEEIQIYKKQGKYMIIPFIILFILFIFIVMCGILL